MLLPHTFWKAAVKLEFITNLGYRINLCLTYKRGKKRRNGGRKKGRTRKRKERRRKEEFISNTARSN